MKNIRIIPLVLLCFAGAAAAQEKVPLLPMADMLVMPNPPKIDNNRLVTISMAEDVPLKDVLQELARMAHMEIEVAPDVTGGIAFTARDKPFNEVIERIARQAGLNYAMQGKVLHIGRTVAAAASPAEPQVQYVQVYSITAKTDNGFWEKLEGSVKPLLAVKNGGGDKPFYIINRQAQTLTVSAFPGQQEQVKTLLNKNHWQ